MSDFRRTPPPRRSRLPLWGGLLIVAGLLAALLFRYLPSLTEPAPSAEPPRPQRTVTLYFAAADGSGLVAETRQLAACQSEAECLQTTVEALLAGPLGPLAPVLPRQAAVRGVSVAGSELQLDFSRALIDSHPGGTLGELLSVYGVTNTVAVNFPQFRQVRLLVEGVSVETLKGHIDLRQPFVPDFGLIVTSPAAPPPGTSPGQSR